MVGPQTPVGRGSTLTIAERSDSSGVTAALPSPRPSRVPREPWSDVRDGSTSQTVGLGVPQIVANRRLKASIELGRSTNVTRSTPVCAMR